jgi:hypothetical protein
MILTMMDNSEAATMLARNVYRYLWELMALDKTATIALGYDAKPGSLLIVEPDAVETWATLDSSDVAFIEASLRWLRDSFPRFTLAGFDAAQFTGDFTRHDLKCGPLKRRRSFVCESVNTIPPVTADIVPLTAADGEAMSRYPQEQVVGFPRPTPTQLFDELVTRAGGEVFAAWRANEIVGYVSSWRRYGNIRAVDYIHVRRECRSRGIGTQLAAFFAGKMLSRELIPYYSNAWNPASERTAEKAGYACCRDMYFADVSSCRTTEVRTPSEQVVPRARVG